MSTIDLSALRAVAESATPGPWIATEPSEWDQDDSTVQQSGVRVNGHSLTWDDHGGEVFEPRDATHIATFDPPTILALLDEIDRLRGTL